MTSLPDLRGTAVIVGAATAGIGNAGGGFSAIELAALAARRALTDAGITTRQVDGLFSSSGFHFLPTLSMAEYLNIQPKVTDASTIGGSVTTVELSELKLGMATANFARSGLAACISLVHEDAGRVLKRVPDAGFDLIFLDSERPAYPGWWPDLKRVLRAGGLLVVDNATSHPEQMASFIALVKADPAFATSLVPVGNGEFLAVKAGRPS